MMNVNVKCNLLQNMKKNDDDESRLLSDLNIVFTNVHPVEAGELDATCSYMIPKSSANGYSNDELVQMMQDRQFSNSDIYTNKKIFCTLLKFEFKVVFVNKKSHCNQLYMLHVLRMSSKKQKQDLHKQDYLRLTFDFFKHYPTLLRELKEQEQEQQPQQQQLAEACDGESTAAPAPVTNNSRNGRNTNGDSNVRLSSRRESRGEKYGIYPLLIYPYEHTMAKMIDLFDVRYFDHFHF